MSRHSNRQLDQQGSILISIIIIVPFLILITTLYLQLAVSGLTVARKDQSQTHAQFAVDAGIDYALQKVNQDATWTSTSGDTGNVNGELELHNENGTSTTFEVDLASNSPSSRTLIAVGRVYRPAGSTTLVASKTIKADLRAVSAGTYSVVTGVGGLFMQNNAKIVGGDVLVNGEINMQNNTQIGLTTNPVKVEVAHQNCPVPADSNYPRLCASGENGQPISIQGEAHIYASVKANNQTNGAGMSNPGLVSGSVAAQALPTHDRGAQVTAVAQTITGVDASCTTVGGTRSWPANLKIVGDVKISKSCKVTLNGNTWITGKLDMDNSGQILVSDGLGTTMPDLMVDGQTVTLSNSAALVANANNTGLRLLTYWSKAACSPDCANVTGPDLFNSRSEPTITLQNSASATQSIFYARWTGVYIKNSGGIGALIGQTVNLSNSATVTFGSTATTGTTFWVLDGYRRGF
ncbi:MAG TPA: hypothetical protein VK978_05120 [Candidatus Saccharimonadales bacterium]|nr:hypothetical protein [Candidatus Saccharimonadales bacterium]